MNDDFQFRRSFLDERNEIIDCILAATSLESVDLDKFESLVSIKDASRRITLQNLPFRQFMAGSESANESSLKLQPKFEKLSETTDGLILDGVRSLELEHIGSGFSGRPCLLQTFKRRLIEDLKDPQYAILLICRPISYVGTSDEERQQNLAELMALMRQLDTTDELICRGYAMGDTTKDIAASVGLTARSVENRRQKILDIFGFERPIQIVKMLVRLEENGLYKIEG